MQRAASHPPRRLALLAGCLACCAAMSGCKLVDQRTFDASADRTPIPRVPPPPPSGRPPPPLASVLFGTPPETWQPGLEEIVRRALARKPEALFQVETLVPARGTPQAQAAAVAAAGQTGGRLVAESIVAAGASSAQLEMTAASDSSVRQAEVRVYVK